MRCDDAESLIASYVGDDLTAGDVAAVRAHVGECGACARLVDAYSESLELVREFSEPEPDSAFYDGVRAAVLERIAAESRARTHTRALAVAASVALIALALALAAYVMRARPSSAPEQAESPSEPAPAPTQPDPVPMPAAPPAPHRVVYHPRRPERPRTRPQADIASAAPVDTDDMLRVEFQTSDPNVRIIWFVPTGRGAAPDAPKSAL